MQVARWASREILIKSVALAGADLVAVMVQASEIFAVGAAIGNALENGCEMDKTMDKAALYLAKRSGKITYS